MLQNEDIRLFVEVIEEESDKKNESRRYASVTDSRSSMKIIEIRPNFNPKLSPISFSVSNSKFTPKINTLNSKRKQIKIKLEKSSYSNIIQKNSTIPLKIEPLFRLSKNISSDNALKNHN